MTPSCPKCRTFTLEPARGTLAEVVQTERALFCTQCHGYWMPHAVVERWQTEPFVEFEEDEPVGVKAEADRRTGLCPSGHGILLRARVEGDQSFYVERCPHCRGVWLDRGDWQRLAAALYLDHLDDLWDPTWQKQRRVEAFKEALNLALKEQLGSELFEQLNQVVRQLAVHPAKAQSLAWITSQLDP